MLRQIADNETRRLQRSIAEGKKHLKHLEEFREKRLESVNQHERQLYMNDQENFIKHQKHFKRLKQMAQLESDQIDEALRTFDSRIDHKRQRRNEATRTLQAECRKHLDGIEAKIRDIKTQNEARPPLKEIKTALKIADRMRTTQSNRTRQLKEFSTELRQENIGRAESVTARRRDNDKELNQKLRDLLKHSRERISAASEIKELFRFDSLQRAEIMSLKKQDQFENMQRRRSYEKVIKDKVVASINEKLMRGALVVSEKQKLSELTFRQKAAFKGFYAKPMIR